MENSEEIEHLPKISYDELTEIDLDLLADIPDSELSAHFEKIALQATEGQLREALNIGLDADVVGHAELVESFARRRLVTAVKLRGLKDS